MKIGYLVNQYPKVSHTFIRREIHAMERQGFDVLRLALRGWNEPTPDAEDAAEKLATHYLLRGGVMALGGALLKIAVASPGRLLKATALALRLARRADRPWLIHLVYLAEACVALRSLRAHGARHVHAHFGTNSAEVALLVSALGGPPYSFTVHGPGEFDMPEFIHLGPKIEGAAFVVAITQYCRSQLYRWVDSSHWHKVQVVHCGIEPAFHRLAAPRPPGGCQLVCVGRLNEQKGHLLLIEAAGLLAARGVVFELVLAGDGELRQAVEQRVSQLGLGARVRITGWIGSPQVRDEILASRALVLASFAEGLPVVLMEAMALRRPVLSTWVNGIPELVRDGHTGWLYAPGDVHALANAMASCLATPDADLARMGEAAHSAVLAMHDIDTEAAKLAALVRRGTEAALVP